MKRSGRRENGQVMTEYVIMLVMILLVVISLKTLGTAMCDQGERMVLIAAYNVP